LNKEADRTLLYSPLKLFTSQTIAHIHKTLKKITHLKLQHNTTWAI